MIIGTTLAEKDYFLGLSALINSIDSNKNIFDKFIVGYRGDLPNWLSDLELTARGKVHKCSNGCVIEFIILNGDLHMVHEKPKWFLYLSEVLEPDANKYIFFDSDIVLINRCTFYLEWIDQGVAICEDINEYMDHRHPIRNQWINIAKNHGFEINNKLDKYYNSGFLGWTKANNQFIRDWEKSFTILSKYSGDMKKFRVTDRTSIVLSANQDSLNLACMVTTVPISPIGPEAMGFKHGMSLMSHPIGPKPWDRNFIYDFFIHGKPPRKSDIVFWKNINGNVFKPLKSYKVYIKLTICFVLKFLSRFYFRK
jgi:hypothetical protein